MGFGLCLYFMWLVCRFWWGVDITHLTGDPKAGTLVELQVIAAVVVGGTSLAGGQQNCRNFDWLLIIGVIRNGMNLAGVEAHIQSVLRSSDPDRSYGRPAKR